MIYNVKKATYKHLKLCMVINASDNLTKKTVLRPPKNLLRIC